MFTITTYFQILDESLNQSAPEVALKGNDFYIFFGKAIPNLLRSFRELILSFNNVSRISRQTFSNLSRLSTL